MRTDLKPGMRIRDKKTGAEGRLDAYDLEGFWKATRKESGTPVIVHEDDIEAVPS
jgi:hypothetical protein